MRQLSSAILIAGGVGVLLVGFNLLRSMTEEPASATPTAKPRPAPPAPAPAPVPSAPTAARSAAKAISSITHDLTTARERPTSNTPAPALPPDQPPPGYGSAHLEYGSKQLHAQTRAVAHLVQQCVEQADAAGRSPTGTVVMSFIVGKHDDKYLVESTDYDYDKTTLDDPELVKCLTETARAMKFVGLPRDSPGVVVRRSVTVDHGILSAYKYVNFSYLR